VPVQSPRQYKMAFQWLLEGARTGSSLPLHQSLAEEVVAILSSSQSEGLKKKEALYKSVVTNRAYSHYRWI
jgi:ribosomal protein S7